MNTDKLWNVRDEIICELATASMKLDRLHVELCDESPYEVPSIDEIRVRILSAMNALARLETHVNEFGTEIKKLESC
jgi:uncharacterized protein involved in tolerance to divalent cations